MSGPDSCLPFPWETDDGAMTTRLLEVTVLPALCVGALCTARLHAVEFEFEPSAVDPAMIAFLDDSASAGLRRANDRELSTHVLGASDFNGTTMVVAGAGVDWFVADGLSVGLFGEGLHINQAGDNALGLGAGFMLRWHFIESQTVSMFTEFGVGYVLFDSPVPVDGVTGDFTPRAAIGADFSLDARTTLGVQAGWLHLSNAQTGENNPGVDALAIGLALRIEF